MDCSVNLDPPQHFARRIVLVVAFVVAAIRLTIAAAAEVTYPISAVAGAEGVVYVADQELPGVWKIVGGKAEVFFQAQKKFRTPLYAVRCVTVDGAGNLLAGDAATMELYRFGTDGKPAPLTGTNVIRQPIDIAVAKSGEVYASDLENNTIWRVPAAGGTPEKFAEVTAPRGLTIAEDGTIWVVTLRENALVRIGPDGTVTPVVKTRAFEFPNDVLVDSSGAIYVSDGYASTIWKVTTAGEASKWVTGKPLSLPVGMSWSGTDMLVADPRARSVFQISPDGKVTTVVVGAAPPPPTPSQPPKAAAPATRPPVGGAKTPAPPGQSPAPAPRGSVPGSRSTTPPPRDKPRGR